MARQVNAVTERLRRSKVDSPVDRRRDIERPPGPRAADLPYRFATGGDICGYFVAVEREYEQIAHTRMLRDHLYILNDPEFIVEFFLNHSRGNMKGRALQGAKAVLGTGLLTSDGDFHLRQRRLVQPAFHRDRVVSYAQTMATITQRHEQRWKEGATFDMVEDMSALTLAIVGETLFGADLTSDAAEMNSALTEVLTGSGARLMMGGGILRLPTPARRRSVESSATLDAIVQRMVDDHRRVGDTGDMLSMLIAAQEDGEGMSDEQVRDEAMTLVLAGHETTAMAMSWTWMLLARNPQVAEWLHEELDSELAGRAPGFEDLGALPRTHAVIAESMRMYPPAWSMGRRVLEDLTLGKWLVPRGAMVLSSQYALQRSPRWWDSPLTFRPQRWIGADGAFSETNPGQPRGAWFPFGWGNRRCIGEQFAWTEAQLILATLAQRWEPQLQQGHAVEPQPAVTLRPKGGLPVTLRRRSGR